MTIGASAETGPVEPRPLLGTRRAALAATSRASHAACRLRARPRAGTGAASRRRVRGSVRTGTPARRAAAARPLPQPRGRQRRRRRRRSPALVALVVRFGLELAAAPTCGVSLRRPGRVDRHGRPAARLRGALPRHRPRGVPPRRRSRRWRCSSLVAVTSFVAAPATSRAAYVLVVVPPLLVLSLARPAPPARPGSTGSGAAGQGLQRVLVVGRADAAVAVIDKFRQEPQHGLLAVAACVPPARRLAGLARPRRPGRRRPGPDHRRGRRRPAPHVVAVASHPDLAGQSLRRLSWALEERGVDLVVVAGHHRGRRPAAVDPPGRRPVAAAPERPDLGGEPDARQDACSTGCSARRCCSCCAPAARRASRSPSRLTSRGPVLFRQTRVGVDGRAVHDAQVPLDGRRTPSDRSAELRRRSTTATACCSRCSDDPRVTRVGAAAAPVLARRAAAAVQRAPRRHVAGRPAPAAARGGRRLRRRRRPPAAGAARA